jgi:hypothetical protein
MTQADREQTVKSLTEKIVKKLDAVSKNIDKIISEIATTTDTSNLYWTKINARIRYEYESARQITRDFILGAFPDYYKKQIREELTRLKNKQIELPKTTTAKDFVSSHGSKQSLRSLMNETINSYRAGLLSGENTLRKLAMLTQQINVEEKKIEKAIADGYLEKGTYQGSKKKVRAELLKKSIDGKYITVIDKNGKPTQWRADTYAEMVTRTKLMEASTQAVIDTAGAVGADLIQWSAHNTLCALCAEFEGMIFSLSGSDPDFPAATELPPRHPNCMHSTSIVFREFLDRQGTLQPYIDFSNGETEVHPTRTAWIPVSKRKLR